MRCSEYNFLMICLLKGHTRKTTYFSSVFRISHIFTKNIYKLYSSFDLNLLVADSVSVSFYLNFFNDFSDSVKQLDCCFKQSLYQGTDCCWMPCEHIEFIVRIVQWGLYWFATVSLEVFISVDSNHECLNIFICLQ